MRETQGMFQAPDIDRSCQRQLYLSVFSCREGHPSAVSAPLLSAPWSPRGPLRTRAESSRSPLTLREALVQLRPTRLNMREENGMKLLIGISVAKSDAQSIDWQCRPCLAIISLICTVLFARIQPCQWTPLNRFGFREDLLISPFSLRTPR